MLDERSICWLLTGGTRDDPPDPRRLEHMRALREGESERRATVTAFSSRVRSAWRSLPTRFGARRALAIPGDCIDCCGVA